MRCPGCRINKRWCFCEHLKSIENKCFLTVIMHLKETQLTSNTSSLALKMLRNSELLIRGHREQDFEFTPRPGYQPLYLFPTEDSLPLTPELMKTFDKPIQLILPDGTWRQAKKFHRREPALEAVPKVRIEEGFEKIYTLRTSPREQGVCSLEAIALAFGIIESQEIKEGLLKALRVMNEKVEISRNPSLW